MATADLTVRGAGILGLSAAFIAAERGARVRVIDPGGPGAGASGGILGALAPHAPDAWNAKKAFQLASLVRAETFWAEVEARGGRPFTDDQIPRAVIRFRQGVGRLIRSATDEGRVVILDPRVATTWYGKRFLDALPEGVTPELAEPMDLF